MKRHAKYLKSSQSGFSTVELLIGVIIIGILVAIIAPIITNRTREARITAANADLEHIANAMAQVVIDTGYVVRLFVLDDAADLDNVGFELPRPAASLDRIDGFADEDDSLVYWDESKFLIHPKTHEYIDNAANIFVGLIPETGFEPSLAITRWRGPYLTWQRDSQLPQITKADTDTSFDDIGDDPWSNNYLFFTRLGLVREVTSETTGEGVNTNFPTNDQLGDMVESVDINGENYECKIFGQFTILSMGPDGLPGGEKERSEIPPPDKLFGTGDDLIRHF